MKTKFEMYLERLLTGTVADASANELEIIGEYNKAVRSQIVKLVLTEAKKRMEEEKISYSDEFVAGLQHAQIICDELMEEYQ